MDTPKAAKYEHVCRELLLNGWTFTIQLGKPDRWERKF